MFTGEISPETISNLSLLAMKVELLQSVNLFKTHKFHTLSRQHLIEFLDLTTESQ